MATSRIEIDKEAADAALANAQQLVDDGMVSQLAAAHARMYAAAFATAMDTLASEPALESYGVRGRAADRSATYVAGRLSAGLVQWPR